jgi:Ca2+-binding EF-hand superfamily protein
VDNETLRRIFEDLGYGEITDEDLEVLVETADMDKDGRISVEDFRTMMGGSRKPDDKAK